MDQCVNFVISCILGLPLGQICAYIYNIKHFATVFLFDIVQITLYKLQAIFLFTKLSMSHFMIVEEHHSLQQKMGMAQEQCNQQEKELVQLR